MGTMASNPAPNGRTRREDLQNSIHGELSEETSSSEPLDAGALFVLKSKGSWLHCGYHLTTSIVAPALLSLPLAVAQLGWAAGVLTLLVAGAVTFYSYTLLSLVLEQHALLGNRLLRFRDMAHHVLGPAWGRYYIGPLQFSLCFTAVVAGTLLAGQSMKAIYLLEQPDGTMKLYEFVVISGAITLILAQFPSFHSLRHFNLISLILCLAYSACATAGSIYIGIQALPTSYGVLLTQQQYANRIPDRAGMTSAKPVLTPTSCKTVLLPTSQDEFSNPSLYRHLIGSLQYLTLTRPDIQFVVHQLSQHMHKPLNTNFADLKRLLRYIKGSTTVGLPIHRDSITLQGFVDADWASNSHDRKSISGYCNFLGKTLISWQVKKQTTVARSSTEAEYCALATEASEVIWLRRLLEDFQLPQANPTIVYCDNASAIALANNPIYHARTKHIDVDCHFIRDCIQAKHIMVHHICTTDQLADIFTKSLPLPRFKSLSSKLIASSNHQF